MEKILNLDIHITRHRMGGFILSYKADTNRYYKRRYIGYGLREATKKFKEYVYSEMIKEDGPRCSEDVVLQALRCICGGNITQARELLGNS
jgi:hypothetical protein